MLSTGTFMRGPTTERAAWYQVALLQKAGRITSAGRTKGVSFEPVTSPVNDRIDDAYRSKYSDSPYLAPMIGERARNATMRIVPKPGADR